MQIVIEISEKTFNNIKERARLQPREKHRMTLEQIVVNGTVLPEKHGRLIEVTDELDYQLSTYERWTGIDELPYEYAVMEIRNAPTILEAYKGESEICGDNRFEIIAKAKEDIISATNIEAAKDEMECLDSFLFRCWQMGWLDKYAPYQKGE